MAEIVFTCRCGMILKVYDEDQIGKGLACPSCGATVIVPACSEPIEASGSIGADSAAGAGAGKWFGLVYLSGIVAVSLGLIKFVLMPALSSPNPVAPIAVARADESAKAPEDDEAEEAPRRLKTSHRAATKKSALGKAAATKAAARPDPRLVLAEAGGSRAGGPESAVPSRPAGDDDADKPDDAAASSSREPGDSEEDSTTPPRDGMRGGLGEPSTTPPLGMGRGPGGMPTGPRGGMPAGPRGGMPAGPRGGMPTGPRRGMGMWPTPFPRPGFPPRPTPTRKSKPRQPLKDMKPIIIGGATAKKSDYAHIENKEARKALEAAAVNARDALSAGVAENFLKQAEDAAKGDEKVLQEIQALRHKILMMKDRSR